MATPAIRPRYPTAAAIERLTAMLHLPPGDQDWEIEVADAARVGEFLDAYESEALDDDERFALMALIVASYDDLLYDGRDEPQQWVRMRRHLLGRFDLHGYTAQYWSLPDEDDDDPDAGFAVTGRMREVMAGTFGPRERWPRRPVVVKRYTGRPDPPAAPGVAPDTMDICDNRDGSGFTLGWSMFGGRPAGGRNFPTAADAQEYAEREFGVGRERWDDV